MILEKESPIRNVLEDALKIKRMVTLLSLKSTTNDEFYREHFGSVKTLYTTKDGRWQVDGLTPLGCGSSRNSHRNMQVTKLAFGGIISHYK